MVQCGNIVILYLRLWERDIQIWLCLTVNCDHFLTPLDTCEGSLWCMLWGMEYDQALMLWFLRLSKELLVSTPHRAFAVYSRSDSVDRLSMWLQQMSDKIDMQIEIWETRNAKLLTVSTPTSIKSRARTVAIFGFFVCFNIFSNIEMCSTFLPGTLASLSRINFSIAIWICFMQSLMREKQTSKINIVQSK